MSNTHERRAGERGQCRKSLSTQFRAGLSMAIAEARAGADVACWRSPHWAGMAPWLTGAAGVLYDSLWNWCIYSCSRWRRSVTYVHAEVSLKGKLLGTPSWHHTCNFTLNTSASINLFWYSSYTVIFFTSVHLLPLPTLSALPLPAPDFAWSTAFHSLSLSWGVISSKKISVTTSHLPTVQIPITQLFLNIVSIFSKLHLVVHILFLFLLDSEPLEIKDSSVCALRHLQ